MHIYRITVYQRQRSLDYHEWKSENSQSIEKNHRNIEWEQNIKGVIVPEMFNFILALLWSQQ